MNPRYLLPLLALMVSLVPLLLPPYYVTLFNYIGLYTLVVLGLVLLTGIGGMTSFGQAAFVGLGAYTSAYLTTSELPGWLAWAGASPWLALLLGILLTVAVALLLGALTLRLSGHYLPLGTIAWGLSLYYLFGTLESLGGHTGVSGLPSISLFGVLLDKGEKIFYLIWAVLLLAIAITQNLLNSREGRAIRALKGGQVMAESMGVNTLRSKMLIFVLSAVFAAVSGWLYAHTQRFVNPTPFGLGMGIDYLFMALIGGVASVWGALLGSGIVTLLKQALQDGLPSLMGSHGNYETIAFGLLIVLLMQRAPGGLWPMLLRFVPARFKARPLLSLDTDIAPLPRRALPEHGRQILEARGVTRCFGGLVANNDMSLQVHSGEILALIGPNGAGKSTLFNQLSGVDTPTSGEVLFMGQRDQRPEFAPCGPHGPEPDLPARQAATRDERAGKRRPRRPPARQARHGRRRPAPGAPRGSPTAQRGTTATGAGRPGRLPVRTGRQPGLGPATHPGNCPGAVRRSLPAATR